MEGSEGKEEINGGIITENGKIITKWKKKHPKQKAKREKKG